jgi:hypothetical protein
LQDLLEKDTSKVLWNLWNRYAYIHWGLLEGKTSIKDGNCSVNPRKTRVQDLMNLYKQANSTSLKQEKTELETV